MQETNETQTPQESMTLTINGITFQTHQSRICKMPYFTSKLSGRWGKDNVIDDPNLDVPSLLCLLLHEDMDHTMQKLRETSDYVGHQVQAQLEIRRATV